MGTLGQILDFPSKILAQTRGFTTSDPVPIKINHINSEPETQPDHEPLNHTNIELESESDSEQSDNSFEEHPSEVSLTDSVHSENYEKILEIAAESEKIEKSLKSTESLEKKAAKKNLRYAAENQYKLLEKLDALKIDSEEDRITRKQTIKDIQTRLDSADQKLNE